MVPRMAIALLSLFTAILVSTQAPSYFPHGAVQYQGIAATRGGISVTGTLDTTNKQMMVKTTHVARSPITSLKIVTSNFYFNPTTRVEAGSGAVASISASIEYPSGTCTQVLFSASANGSIPDINTLTSDATMLFIPTGAQFWVRQFWRSTGGIIYTASYPQVTGDQIKRAVSGLTDQTMSCDAITGGATGLHLPLAIIASTASPTLCLLGDSIPFGNITATTFDTPNANGDLGLLSPTLGPLFGYSNISASADTAASFVAGNTQRVKVLPFCSHGIVEYGTNDLFAGDSAATLQANLSTIYGLFPATSKVFQTTILPRPTTSDGCATLGNQTLPSFEAARLTMNNALKGATFGPNSGTFDTSSLVETATNSGFWKTSPSLWSADCIHPSVFGYAQYPSSGIIDTARIHRP